MAKQRYLNTKFWTDTYITSLDPIEKLLFLYFITNHLTNISGVYEIQLKQVAFDTGIHLDMVEKIMARFERDKKIVYRSGWVCAVNFVKHQVTNSPQVQAGIIRELNGAPKELIPYVYGIGTLLNLDLDLTLTESKLEPIPNEDPPKKPAKVSVPIPLPPKQKKDTTIKDAFFKTWNECFLAETEIPYTWLDADWAQYARYKADDIGKEKLVSLVRAWFAIPEKDIQYYPREVKAFFPKLAKASALAKSTKSSKDDFNKISGWDGK